MKTIPGIFLTEIMGWNIENSFPEIDKSIVLYESNNHFHEAFIIDLFLKEYKIKHRFLTNEEVSHFPLNVLKYKFNQVPEITITEFVHKISEILFFSNNMHLVVPLYYEYSDKSTITNFIYQFTSRSNIPLLMIYIDYPNKKIGVLRIKPKSDYNLFNQLYFDKQDNFSESNI